MKKRHITLLTAFAAAAALAPTAQAQTLITGATATASSEIPGRVAANAVNGSGFTGSLGTGTHDGNPGNAWEGLAGTNTTGWLSVDLGAIYDVNDMYFWNGAGGDPLRGVGTANIYYSTLASPDTSNFAGGDWALFQSAQAFTVLPGGGSPYSVSDIIALDVTARHVAFEMLSNHGNGGGVTGINEVQFDGTLVSEPSTTLAITSITSLGSGDFELTLKGGNLTAYEFYSSTSLDFDSGTLVENLVQIVGSVGGTNDSVLTTDGSGNATVQMELTGSPPRTLSGRRRRLPDQSVLFRRQSKRDGGGWGWPKTSSTRPRSTRFARPSSVIKKQD